MLPLFDAYPTLSESLAHIPICDLPTPVDRLPIPGLDDLDLWVKRDDISAPLFGGNKAHERWSSCWQKRGITTAM